MNVESSISGPRNSRLMASASMRNALSSTSMKKPLNRGNFILRQELNSYTPECNPKCGIIFNIVLALIFIGAGIPIILLANNTHEHIITYTNCTDSNSPVWSSKGKCSLNFTLTESLKPPILIYYELDNFHLNHRNLVKSKVWAQLRGEVHVDSSSNSRCSDALSMNQIVDNDTSRYVTYTGEKLVDISNANPCGLIAKSFFNDTYKITKNGEEIFLNQTDISNSYLKKVFYKNNQNSSSLQWLDITDEHFINWMQMETLSSFRKLFARIDTEMNNGTYNLEINYNYPTVQFESNKSLIIATSSPLGNTTFYGYLLIIAAAYSAIIVVILWILLSSSAERKFDYSHIKWS